MQLDYITIQYIIEEIHQHVMESYIRDIIAFGKRSVVLVLKNDSVLPLLFSADAENSRIHLLKETPSRSRKLDEHFHRTLRHHIDGAVIEDFLLVPDERIIEIHLARKEFSGEIKRSKFIAELMGRHSNLILVDESDSIIVSDHAQSSRGGKSREIGAGRIYTRPPSQERIPLEKYSPSDFKKFVESSSDDIPWGKLFLKSFSTVTPGFVKYISNISKLDSSINARDLEDNQIKSLHESFLTTIDFLDKKSLFPPYDEILNINKTDDFPINRALAQYYADTIRDKKTDQRVNQWHKAVEARMKSLKKLSVNLNKDLTKAQKAEGYRKQGDLIYAFINEFKPGNREIEVDDITDPESGEKVKLKLLRGKDAVQSAQDYHKRASRMTRGVKEITSRIDDTQKKLDEFSALIDPSDDVLNLDNEKFKMAIDEVKGGRARKYIKKAKDQKAIELPKNLRGANIHHYRSKEGHDIYVGGNERANEALYRWGHPDDYWLHVKNIPGSHVLIPRRGTAIEYDTLVFAAQLAIHHSKVKGATKVPVDYTLLKYVKKPPGAELGYVIYSKEKNILADSPTERELKKRKV